MWLFIAVLLILFALILKYLNRDYFILAGCRRIKTVDGSELSTKIRIISGISIFGNNLDVIGGTPESTFKFAREACKKANHKAYILHFLLSPVYGITNAEDAEEIFQSQALITKSHIYRIIEPFMGQGLLLSTDELWHFRRKLLTPTFHFNILQNFLEVFKEESCKIIKNLRAKENGLITLNEVIPQFTLNNICETALGVKLDDLPGSEDYRNAVNSLEPLFVNRLCNPILFFPVVYKFTTAYKKQVKLLQIVHSFSSQIIERKRKEFRIKKEQKTQEDFNMYGKKIRYAMLDTLLEAEKQGQINHQGICDEVNTFMFEGYDTTSVCLMFSLVNLATHPDAQQKCYEEIQFLAPLDELTVFDLNKLDYLECVIKETLRLYPSVPFLARGIVTDTVINGLILPPNADIHIHTYEIMRDERHFPEPNKFDPDRFRSENTTTRNPFAFVPFSAGPRNCIGQKFAILEMKMLLVAILKNFYIQPITRLDEVTFENGLVLRTKEKLQIKIVPRE